MFNICQSRCLQHSTYSSNTCTLPYTPLPPTLSINKVDASRLRADRGRAALTAHPLNKAAALLWFDSFIYASGATAKAPHPNANNRTLQ